MSVINFDHMSHPSLSAAAAEAMAPWLRPGPQWSPHASGAGATEAARAVDAARAEVARFLDDADPEEIVFTASGSEALNLAVKGLAWASPARRVVVSAVEHAAVRHAATFLARGGVEITVLPVSPDGAVDLDALRTALEPAPALVAVQAASNEIGTVQPLAAVGRMCAARNVPLVVDAVVAAGRIPVTPGAWQAAAVAVAAHQFGGPRGAGALWVRAGVRLLPLVHGGIQEDGRRAGSESVAAVAGMGAAARFARETAPARAEALRAAHDGLLALADALGLPLTGSRTARLPGHVSVLADGVEGESVVADLALQGILASTGSPCTRADLASRVLTALGLSPARARGSLAFTAGPGTGAADVAALAAALPASLDRLRALLPRS